MKYKIVHPADYTGYKSYEGWTGLKVPGKSRRDCILLRMITNAEGESLVADHAPLVDVPAAFCKPTRKEND